MLSKDDELSAMTFDIGHLGIVVDQISELFPYPVCSGTPHLQRQRLQPT